MDPDAPPQHGAHVPGLRHQPFYPAILVTLQTTRSVVEGTGTECNLHSYSLLSVAVQATPQSAATDGKHLTTVFFRLSSGGLRHLFAQTPRPHLDLNLNETVGQVQTHCAKLPGSL